MTENNQLLNLEDEPKGNEQPTNSQPNVEDIKNYLSTLVGDGKKFTDEEALAKSKYEADQFIEHLKGENQGMRETIKELQEQLNNAKTQGELDQLRKKVSEELEEQKASKESNPSPSVSPEDLEKMIEDHLTKRETESSAKANVDQTNNALVKHFGDPEKAKEAIQQRVSQLGISLKDLTAMAAKSPSAALALIQGGSVEQSRRLDLRSSVSSEAASGDGIASGSTKAEFDKLRQENPTKYWSPAVQNKIMALAREGKYN